MEIKIGDRIRCNCCDEVKGVVIGDWTDYNGIKHFRVQNDEDVCGGGETIVDYESVVLEGR